MSKLSSAFYETYRDLIPDNISSMITHGAPPHFHHQMELLCVSKGSFSVTINNDTRVLAKGGVAVADSFDAHSYTMLEPDSVGYVAIIKKDHITEYHALTKNSVLSQNFLIDPDFFKQAEPLFLRLNSFTDTGSPSKRLYRKALATAILALIAEYGEYQERDFENDAPKIRDILKYIYDNSHQPLTLNGLAKHYGYTPTHFSYVFNKSTGFKLKEYINRIRTQKAATYIKQGVPLTQAAFDAGFESLSSFYRIFKTVNGLPPKQYLSQGK